jgi:hypothetical protein
MGLLFFLQSKQKRTHFWTCIGTLQSLWNPANLLRYSAFKMIDLSHFVIDTRRLKKLKSLFKHIFGVFLLRRRMMMKKLLVATFALVLVAFLGSVAIAKEAVLSVSDCVKCHSEQPAQIAANGASHQTETHLKISLLVVTAMKEAPTMR